LPKLASGEAIATLAIDESAKHRPWAGHTAASAEGDGWVINGSKTFVPDGHIADVLLVVARSAGEDGEAEGLSVFIVPRDAAGVSVERTAMADAHNAARVTFTNVNVSRDALLGEPNVAAPAIEAALQAGRVAASAEMLGIADEVFERTMQYLKERKQFGKLIGEFQALQHRAAHLYTEIEITRAAVIRAQQALDADEDGVARHVQVAKARAGRTVTLAVQEAVQMHGGMGMTDAFDFGLFMKRARVLEELYGDANQHLNAFATGRGY
jgi:alkylation response protein AidB-like acyl-CoA dehydrogenase